MEVGVFAYITDEKGRVLMVRDATRQQLWTLPGGGPEFQELMPDALVREVREETGAGVQTGKLLGIFSQKKAPGIVIVFEATIVEGEPHADGVETQDVGFFSMDELMSMREQIKPAQLSIVYQVSNAEGTLPIFNHFVAPSV